MIHVQPFLLRLISRLVKVVFIINNHCISSVRVYKSQEWEDVFKYIDMSKKVCVFSSPVTDTCCIISAGCQSLSPSRRRILQSNAILCVCQWLSRDDTFSLRPRQNMTFVVVLLKTFAVRRKKIIITPLDSAVTFSKTFYVPLISLQPLLDTCHRAGKQTSVPVRS